jgi:hypothetical protein
MVWCSVKEQGKLYLFTLIHQKISWNSFNGHKLRGLCLLRLFWGGGGSKNIWLLMKNCVWFLGLRNWTCCILSGSFSLLGALFQETNKCKLRMYVREHFNENCIHTKTVKGMLTSTYTCIVSRNRKSRPAMSIIAGILFLPGVIENYGRWSSNGSYWPLTSVRCLQGRSNANKK